MKQQRAGAQVNVEKEKKRRNGIIDEAKAERRAEEMRRAEAANMKIVKRSRDMVAKPAMGLATALNHKKFTDETFPVEDAIFWADYDFEASTKIASQAPKTSWRRASDKYPDYTLWGPNGVIPNDIA